MTPKGSSFKGAADVSANQGASRSEPRPPHTSNTRSEGSVGEQLKGTNMDVAESAIISIVDDDESVRDAVESLLKSLGFGVAVFASAEGFLHSGQLQDTACLIL